MKKINIYCGYKRNTAIKRIPIIINDFVFQIPCLECNGTKYFDCGIEDEKTICITCKGTGIQLLGI